MNTTLFRSMTFGLFVTAATSILPGCAVDATPGDAVDSTGAAEQDAGGAAEQDAGVFVPKHDVSPYMLPINGPGKPGDPGMGSAACYGCVDACAKYKEGPSCAGDCTSVCEPINISSLNNDFTSFEGPCETAAQKCLSLTNYVGDAVCYVEWLYCMITTGDN